MDLMGPIEVQSINKHKYVLVLVDDHTRYVWLRFLKAKNESESEIKSWFNLVERQHDTKVKVLRSDRGGEFLSNSFRQWLTTRLRYGFHEILCVTPVQNMSVHHFWFIREQQQTGIVKVTPIPTKAQLADHLTKSLNRPQFESVVQMSGQAIVSHK
jgi:hypothetical protein